jgi:hypothetical protein
VKVGLTINSSSAQCCSNDRDDAAEEHSHSSTKAIGQGRNKENPQNIPNPIASTQYPQQRSRRIMKLCLFSRLAATLPSSAGVKVEKGTFLPNRQLLHIIDQTRIIALHILAHQRDKDQEIQRPEPTIVPPMSTLVIQVGDLGHDFAVDLSGFGEPHLEPLLFKDPNLNQKSKRRL